MQVAAGFGLLLRHDGWGTGTLRAVRPIVQGEIPAFVGMTWEVGAPAFVGMTWEGGNDGRGRLARARVRTHEFPSDSVEFCRIL